LTEFEDSASQERLDHGADSPADRLLTLVQQILAKNLITLPLTINDSLTEAGLASLDMVHLMLIVEAEFEILLPASEITVENFYSISTIEALVMRLRQPIIGT
jgi:acyl carrier protein